MIKPRIGIDLDEVLISHSHYWNEYRVAKHVMKGCIPGDTINNTWASRQAQDPEIWEAFLTDVDFNAGMELRPKVAVSLAYLAKSYDIYCVTARRPEIHKLTRAWLEAVGVMPYFRNVDFVNDKWAFCQRMDIDLLLDDSPVQIEPFLGDPYPFPRQKKILIWDAPYNQSLDGARVTEWGFGKGKVVTEIENALAEPDYYGCPDRWATEIARYSMLYNRAS